MPSVTGAAEVIGIGSGALALTQSATKALLSVYREVTGFEGNQKSIRDTRRDLEAFEIVLNSLEMIARNDPGSLPDLHIPLSSCANDCEEFKKLIIQCTSNPCSERYVVRDWAILFTKEDEIAIFKDKLARYKSTITLALCASNLRIVNANAKVLDEVEELVRETRLELEEQFSKLDNRLKVNNSADDAAEYKWIRKERESTKRWLSTLAEISEHINRARSSALADLSITQRSRYTEVATLGDLISATRMSSDGLYKFSGDLFKVTDKLEDHLQQIDHRMQKLSLPNVGTSNGGEAARKRIQEEQENIQSSLSICDEVAEQVEQVRTNVFDGVSAAQDSFQMVVSTIGDLVSARNVTAGVAATQVLGQASDATLQQVSRDRTVPPRSVRVSGTDKIAGGNIVEHTVERCEKDEVKTAKIRWAGEKGAQGKKVEGGEVGAQNETLYDVQ